MSNVVSTQAAISLRIQGPQVPTFRHGDGISAVPAAVPAAVYVARAPSPAAFDFARAVSPSPGPGVMPQRLPLAYAIGPARYELRTEGRDALHQKKIVVWSLASLGSSVMQGLPPIRRRMAPLRRSKGSKRFPHPSGFEGWDSNSRHLNPRTYGVQFSCETSVFSVVIALELHHRGPQGFIGIHREIRLCLALPLTLQFRRKPAVDRCSNFRH